MSQTKNEKQSIDIFRALLDSVKKRKRAKRENLLKSISVKEFFEEGSVRINMNTCKGIECQLCIKVCPTKALYWKAGEVAIVDDLCIYCTSCVLNCMIDGCIQVSRKRKNGITERFSRPAEVFTLGESLNADKRAEKIGMVLPDEESYLNRYRKPHFQPEAELDGSR